MSEYLSLFLFNPVHAQHQFKQFPLSSKLIGMVSPDNSRYCSHAWLEDFFPFFFFSVFCSFILFYCLSFVCKTR